MLTVIMAAFAPGIALLSFFYLKKQFDHEPIYLVIRLFIFGSLLVFPVMVLQYTLNEGLAFSPVIQAIFNAALFEEFFKWFILFFIAYSHAEFDQHYDGIIYSVAVGLGFASIENVMYLWVYGIEEAWMRAVLPVSSHALYGVVMGYYLGKSKVVENKLAKKRFILYSIFIPWILHGTYNYILLLEVWWMWIITPFMLFLWWNGMRKVRKATSDLFFLQNPPSTAFSKKA